MKFHSDRVVAIVLIALAGTVYALTYWFDPVPLAIQQGMGPERFPRMIAVAIIAMAIALFFMRRGNTPSDNPPVDPVVYVVIAGGIGFMAIVPIVGLIVALGLSLVALGLLWGERRYGALAANAVILPAIVWAAFVKGLKVPLPVGYLGHALGF